MYATLHVLQLCVFCLQHNLVRSVLPDFLADKFQEDIATHSVDKLDFKSGGFHKLQIKTYENVRYGTKNMLLMH